MFNPANGLLYEAFLDGLHERFMFDWYLEVGCRSGRIFGQSRSKTIAVDPFFRVKSNVIGVKPALHLFQTTSDEFFAQGFLKAMKAQLSVSFLDGMHLCEYLLRDFINAEAASNPDGVIAMHDCCPANIRMTTRNLKSLPKGAWTGDVWKLIPILQKYRPDLTLTILDAAPTGLALVSGLDRKSKVLEKNYDAILAEFMELSIVDYGIARFYDSFEYTGTEAMMAAGYPLFAKVALSDADLRIPTRITP